MYILMSGGIAVSREALEGIRVIEIANVIAGPWAAGLLADFGAEVLKIEMPGRGDTVRAMGPLKAFFHIADTVIQMDSYQVLDITKKVKDLCGKYPLNASHAPAFIMPKSNRIMTAPPVKGDGYKDLKLKVHGKDSFSLGKETIDLRYVEQIADPEQTAALGQMLKYAREHLIDHRKSLSQVIDLLEKKLEKEGLPGICSSSYTPCGLAMPRRQEIYSCFNRYRR